MSHSPPPPLFFCLTSPAPGAEVRWGWGVFGAALSGGPARPRYSQQAGMSQSVLRPAVSASLIHMSKHERARAHTHTHRPYAKVATPWWHRRAHTHTHLKCQHP